MNQKILNWYLKNRIEGILKTGHGKFKIPFFELEVRGVKASISGFSIEVSSPMMEISRAEGIDKIKRNGEFELSINIESLEIVRSRDHRIKVEGMSFYSFLEFSEFLTEMNLMELFEELVD